MATVTPSTSAFVIDSRGTKRARIHPLESVFGSYGWESIVCEESVLPMSRSRSVPGGSGSRLRYIRLRVWDEVTSRRTKGWPCYGRHGSSRHKPRAVRVAELCGWKNSSTWRTVQNLFNHRRRSPHPNGEFRGLLETNPSTGLHLRLRLLPSPAPSSFFLRPSIQCHYRDGSPPDLPPDPRMGISQCLNAIPWASPPLLKSECRRGPPKLSEKGAFRF